MGIITSLEKFFKVKESGSTFRTEVIAGITTFMTMAYIIAVNPSMLAVTGMDQGAVFVATVLASAIGSILMGLQANYPFALAPGMGLNAFFAYTVCGAMGYSWQAALAAVLIEGVIFFILSITGVREWLFNAIPKSLKLGISAGIGLFIAFIGLQNAKIVTISPSTAVTMFDFNSGENPISLVVTVILAMVGVLITAGLTIAKVKGSILLGIIATWVLGILCQLCGLYVPDVEAGLYSLIPSGIVSAVPSLSTFCQLDFSSIGSFGFLTMMLSFLYVDMFDTMGTLIGVATKADMLDKNGKLPRIKGAMMADAEATGIGAILGTSTVTTFVESAAGVATGGRTGLTACVTGLLFIVSLFFSPIFLAIPSFATAPALIIVGFMMVESITQINFKYWRQAVPAYIAFIMMPFAYSISEGIALGVIAYVILNLIFRPTDYGKTNRITVVEEQEGQVGPLLIALAIIFILKYILV